MEENDVSGNKRNQKIIWNRRQPRKCVERLDLNIEKGNSVSYSDRRGLVNQHC